MYCAEFFLDDDINYRDTGEITYIYQPEHGYISEDYIVVFAPKDQNGNQVFESNVFKFQIDVSQ